MELSNHKYVRELQHSSSIASYNITSHFLPFGAMREYCAISIDSGVVDGANLMPAHSRKSRAVAKRSSIWAM